MYLKRLILSAVLLFCSACWGSKVPPAHELAQEKLEERIANAEMQRDEELTELKKQGIPEAQNTDEFPSTLKQSAAAPVYIEILWKVPQDAVTAYHIRWGLSPSKLDSHARIRVEDLVKAKHPVHGEVYTYKIKGGPRDKETYVSLQAENDHGVSPSTQEFRISPSELR